jgi:hypothetical protein
MPVKSIESIKSVKSIKSVTISGPGSVIVSVVEAVLISVAIALIVAMIISWDCMIGPAIRISIPLIHPPVVGAGTIMAVDTWAHVNREIPCADSRSCQEHRSQNKGIKQFLFHRLTPLVRL